MSELCSSYSSNDVLNIFPASVFTSESRRESIIHLNFYYIVENIQIRPYSSVLQYAG